MPDGDDPKLKILKYRLSTKASSFLLPTTLAPLDLAAAQRRYLEQLYPNRKACQGCGTYEGVELESARTAYVQVCTKQVGCVADGCKEGYQSREACPHWPKEDPNAPIPLCRKCAKLHHEHWDAMWAEFNNGRL